MRFDLYRLDCGSLKKHRRQLTELVEKMRTQKELAPSIETVWLTPEQYGQLEDAVNRQLRTTQTWDLAIHDAAVKPISR